MNFHIKLLLWAKIAIIVIVFLLVFFLLVGCTPQTADCPLACSDQASYQAQCADHYGTSYAVAVRQCPVGLVPPACASLSEATEVGILCPGWDEEQDVLCCYE